MSKDIADEVIVITFRQPFQSLQAPGTEFNLFASFCHKTLASLKEYVFSNLPVFKFYDFNECNFQNEILILLS